MQSREQMGYVTRGESLRQLFRLDDEIGGGVMRWRSGWVMLAVSILLTCTSPLVPDRDAGLVGVIVRAGPGLWSGDPGGLFQVHVKADPQEECGIIFTIDSATSISDARSGGPRSADRSVLTEGARVAVWFDLVLESCPGQSWAQVIERRD